MPSGLALPEAAALRFRSLWLPMLRSHQTVDVMIHVVIVQPLGFLQRANFRETQPLRNFLRPEIVLRDRDQAPAEPQIFECIIEYRLTTLRHNSLPFAVRGDPVSRKPDAVTPVDAVVSNDAHEPPHRPDPAGKRPRLGEIALRRSDVRFRVSESLRRIHPRQPDAQSSPVRVNDSKQRLGVRRLDLPQFQTGIDQVTKHGSDSASCDATQQCLFAREPASSDAPTTTI